MVPTVLFAPLAGLALLATAYAQDAPSPSQFEGVWAGVRAPAPP